MNKFLKIAVAVAETSSHRFQMAAVVVRGGSVVSVGINKRRNDANFIHWEHCSEHAEVAALRKAGYPKGVKLYVARILRNGEPANAMPCPNCKALIKSLNIKVYWTK